MSHFPRDVFIAPFQEIRKDLSKFKNELTSLEDWHCPRG